jgi:hypothetical protein
MNENNRVLSRVGARELTQEEIRNVTGGLRTATPCTVNGVTAVIDGETADCGG